MERTIWKGVLRTWQLLRRSAATLKRPGRKSPSSRSASAPWSRELTAFLKAYASGLITLPEGMMEAEAAADPGENEMEDTEYEE